MTHDHPRFWNRPLWGKPRPNRHERETDAAKVRQSRLENDRFTRNGARIAAPAVLVLFLSFSAMFSTLAASLPGASLREFFLDPELRATPAMLGVTIPLAFGLAAVVWAFPTLLRRFARHGLPRVYRVDDQQRRRQSRIAMRVIWATGAVYLLFIVAMALMSESGFACALLLGSHAAVIGAATLSAGVRWSTGDACFCARCAYPYSAELPRCPECGAHWDQWWQVRMGRPVRRPRLAVLGSAMLVAGFAAIVLGGTSIAG